MNRPLPWITAAMVAVIVIAFYFFRASKPPLNVVPRAAEEIEKAKRR